MPLGRLQDAFILWLLGVLSSYLVVSLQHTSMSPDGKLLVIVGDDPDGMLVDSQTGKVALLSLPTHMHTRIFLNC